MAHQSLYRKYRPATFNDLVGQSHIVRTLRNAVADGSVAHAYLFTGPRGTGKTTTARILAKALLCEKGPTPDPDATCQQCMEVAEDRHPDVFEIDAASNTGVDNVRDEIIKRLAYASTRGGYRVYIIDEVHMLSQSAFNALLKSIEEPPPNVVFVLCTTHPHKVPETIQSRCQRFDFHRIGMDDLVGRLGHISENEGIKVAPGAHLLIARHAAGGMRDAITTLEQLAAFTGDDISLDDVEGLLGEVDTALLFEVTDLVAARDVAGCFGFVSRLVQTGIDITDFVRDFTSHVRDLYVTAAVGDPTGLVETTSDQLGRLVAQASLFGVDRLARILGLLGELGAELRWSSDPRLSLEVSFTRMARPEGELTLDSLAERVDALEHANPVASAQSSVPAASAPAPTPAADAPEPPQPAHAPYVDPTPVSEPAATVGAERSDEPLDRAHVKRAWPAVLAEFRKLRPSRAGAFTNTEVDVDGSTLVIEFPADAALVVPSQPETREVLGRALGVVLGAVPPFRYQQGRGAVVAVSDKAPQAAAPRDEAASAAADDASHEVPTPKIAPILDSGPGLAAVDAGQAGPSGTADSDDTADLDEIMRTQFGAQMVAEHPHEPTRGEDGI
ncbi:MAG: DNA polymerase III subunit gamma/tau [Coriobacteriia bacterium]